MGLLIANDPPKIAKVGALISNDAAKIANDGPIDRERSAEDREGRRTDRERSIRKPIFPEKKGRFTDYANHPFCRSSSSRFSRYAHNAGHPALIGGPTRLTTRS